MAKHISKSVIEDIAYQLKNAGQWVHENKLNPEYIREQDLVIDLSDPEDVLDDLTSQIAGVLDEHDPTFDKMKFLEQASYRVDI